MHRSYKEILDRIEEPPKWWDENAVPRYVDFAPEQMGVYDDCVVFALISCQHCAQEFKVAMSDNHMERFKYWKLWLEKDGKGAQSKPNPRSIAIGFHYGDPPNHDCVGDTENCNDIEILEVWAKNNNYKWERHKDIEKEANQANDGVFI